MTRVGVRLTFDVELDVQPAPGESLVDHVNRLLLEEPDVLLRLQNTGHVLEVMEIPNDQAKE